MPEHIERLGRIETEYYDTHEEALIRHDELKADLAKDPTNDQSVIVIQSRNSAWMDDGRTYYGVRWVKPVAER